MFKSETILLQFKKDFFGLLAICFKSQVLIGFIRFSSNLNIFEINNAKSYLLITSSLPK